MFYNENLSKYRYANYISNIKPYVTEYFVFSENEDDFISIHGKPYTSVWKPITAFNQKLIILGGHGRGFPQIAFLRYLKFMIGFSPSIQLTHKNVFEEVFVGHADMNMEKIINIPTPISLLPTMRVADNLWILDMPLKRSSTYFLELFEFNLWITFLLTFIGIGFLSVFGTYILRRYARQNLVNDFNWFSVFVNQGASEINNLLSRKILMLALSLLTIIFHGSFQSFISSYQAIRHPDISFNDLEGLMKSSDYTICAHVNSPGYKHIRNTWTMADMKARVNNANCLDTFVYDTSGKDNNLNRTSSCPINETAVLISDNNFRFNGSQQLCHFTPLSGSYFTRYLSIMVGPGWIYNEEFNQKLIVLRTSGILSKFGLEVKYYKEIQEPNGTAVQIDDLSIDVNQTKYIFMLFMLGILICTVVLLLERLVKKYF